MKRYVACTLLLIALVATRYSPASVKPVQITDLSSLAQVFGADPGDCEKCPDNFSFCNVSSEGHECNDSELDCGSWRDACPEAGEEPVAYCERGTTEENCPQTSTPCGDYTQGTCEWSEELMQCYHYDGNVNQCGGPSC